MAFCAITALIAFCFIYSDLLDKFEQLLDMAMRFINLRKKVTVCRQDHFEQLCNRCREYDGCKLYSDYCDAWIKLQKVAEEIEDGDIKFNE